MAKDHESLDVTARGDLIGQLKRSWEPPNPWPWRQQTGKILGPRAGPDRGKKALLLGQRWGWRNAKYVTSLNEVGGGGQQCVRRSGRRAGVGFLKAEV